MATATAEKQVKAEGTGSPTVKWVDWQVSRKAAKGATEQELKAYRKQLLERHGLVEAARKADREAKKTAAKAA